MSTNRDLYEPSQPEKDEAWRMPVNLWPVSDSKSRRRVSMNANRLKVRFNNNEPFWTSTGLPYHKTDFPPDTKVVLHGGAQLKLIVTIS